MRGANLTTDCAYGQLDLFYDFTFWEKQQKLDIAVDEIRRRFGYHSIQRGLMYQDQLLSAINAKDDHIVHPHSYS